MRGKDVPDAERVRRRGRGRKGDGEEVGADDVVPQKAVKRQGPFFLLLFFSLFFFFFSLFSFL